MKILNRYVFRELLGPFFLGLVVFSFVIIPRLRVLELLVQKNVVPQEILLILFYILPTILTFSLPMAALLAILISFGRLSADNEVTAMRSSGSQHPEFGSSGTGVCRIHLCGGVFERELLATSRKSETEGDAK